jgi:hypothetical protein
MLQPQRQQERQMEIRGRGFEKGGLVVELGATPSNSRIVQKSGLTTKPCNM